MRVLNLFLASLELFARIIIKTCDPKIILYFLIFSPNPEHYYNSSCLNLNIISWINLSSKHFSLQCEHEDGCLTDLVRNSLPQFKHLAYLDDDVILYHSKILYLLLILNHKWTLTTVIVLELS